MKERWGLVVLIDRCIGCYACELACKQEHNLPEGVRNVQLETIGPYELDGKLVMDFIPQAGDGCDLCATRVAAGGTAFCAEVCPTQALGLFPAQKILKLLHGKRRVQICRMADLASEE
ncbi:MAG: hypothetical protein JXA42_11880 [Anaerolineales bacterium]|nr:hypothetical protein [Anaerolineales bacterium]